MTDVNQLKDMSTNAIPNLNFSICQEVSLTQFAAVSPFDKTFVSSLRSRTLYIIENPPLFNLYLFKLGETGPLNTVLFCTNQMRSVQ